MNEYGSIYIHLDELLRRKGLSKKKFAEMAKMQRSQINHFCNNAVTRFDADVLSRICTALNCTIGDLLEHVPSSHNEE